MSEHWSFETSVTNSGKIYEQLFKLSRPQGQIIDVKCEKSQQIGHFDFFSAIIELVLELDISNMYNKFGKDTWETFQVIAPTSEC